MHNLLPCDFFLAISMFIFIVFFGLSCLSANLASFDLDLV